MKKIDDNRCLNFMKEIRSLKKRDPFLIDLFVFKQINELLESNILNEDLKQEAISILVQMLDIDHYSINIVCLYVLSFHYRNLFSVTKQPLPNPPYKRFVTYDNGRELFIKRLNKEMSRSDWEWKNPIYNKIWDVFPREDILGKLKEIENLHCLITR